MATDSRAYQQALERYWQECPSEQQESCELGDVCECRAKAKRATQPAQGDG